MNRFIRKTKTAFLLLIVLLQPLYSQSERISLSETIRNSDLIVYAKVNDVNSKWVDDYRGRHIYSDVDLEIMDIAKGSSNSKFISLEIVGGTVGSITEVTSESFTAKKNDEFILMLNKNPMRIISNNNAVFRVNDGKVLLQNTAIGIKGFLGVLDDISNNVINVNSIKEIENAVNQKQINSQESSFLSDTTGSIKNRKHEKSVTSISANPNLFPYQPAGWGDIIVLKKTTVTAPITTQFAADDSPLYDSDNLYLGFSVANGGGSSASNFNVKVYIDNSVVFSQNYSQLNAGYYVSWYNASIGALSVGQHSIKIIVDEANQIVESDETDNQYTRTVTIQHISGTPLITSINPSTASAGTGTQVTITGTDFGATRGTSKVEFFFQSGQPKIESSNYISWSNTQIVCEVPVGIVDGYAGSASSGPVTVTTSAGTSNGYDFNISFGYGGVKWSGSFPNIKFKINENLGSVTGEGAAIQAAMNTWSSAGANFNFLYDGQTSITTSGFDSTNALLFGSTSGSIATNYYWFDNGVILESDIVFNSDTFAFSTTGDAGTYDIQSIATHELGHSLNLRDLYGNNDADKIMYGFGSSGEVKRTLSSNDVEGIKYIYGTGGSNAEYTISGTVSLGSNPISGIGVILSGDLNQTDTTDVNGNYTFTVQENGNYIVTPSGVQYNFTPANKSFTNVVSNQTQNFTAAYKTFIITASADSGGTITPSGNVSVNYGSSKTFHVQADTGYNVSSLTIDSLPAAADTVYTFNNITSNHSITAGFAKNIYTVSLISKPQNGGTVTGGGNYEYKTNLTVHAIADSGYKFINWTEDSVAVSTDSNYTFQVLSNRSLTANFSKLSYYVLTSSEPAEGGTTSGGGAYEYGTNVTVNAFVNPGYKFINWTEGTDTISSNSSYSFEIMSNRSLVAHFSKLLFNILTTSEPAEGGTTTGAGVFEYGTTVTLTAIANPGYKFINWSEGINVISFDSSYSIVVDSNKSLTANFSKSSFNVSINVDPPEGGTVSGSGVYNFGTNVTVNASPKHGYYFVNWTDGSKEVSTDSSYSFVLNSNISLIAHFSKMIYNITAGSNPPAGGTITGTGSYEFGAAVTLTANPTGTYQFINWTENGNEISTDSILTFIAGANRALAANFDRPPEFTNALPDNTLIPYTKERIFFSFQYRGSDPDSDEILFSLVDKPDGAEITKDGLFTWAPTFEQSSKDYEIKVKLSDGLLFVVKTTPVHTIVISGANNLGYSIPTVNKLYQNYPNPFNPTTVIKYALAQDANVQVSIYNLLGQKVEELFNGMKSAGYYSVEWKAANLPSGIYFCHIEIEPVNNGSPYRENRKMILLK